MKRKRAVPISGFTEISEKFIRKQSINEAGKFRACKIRSFFQIRFCTIFFERRPGTLSFYVTMRISMLHIVFMRHLSAIMRRPRGVVRITSKNLRRTRRRTDVGAVRAIRRPQRPGCDGTLRDERWCEVRALMPPPGVPDDCQTNDNWIMETTS